MRYAAHPWLLPTQEEALAVRSWTTRLANERMMQRVDDLVRLFASFVQQTDVRRIANVSWSTSRIDNQLAVVRVGGVGARHLVIDGINVRVER